MTAARLPGVEAWSGLAHDYESWFETDLGAFAAARELEALQEVLAPCQRRTAIEVGAGTGFVARALRAWGWRVTAVEPSPAMRTEGVRRSPGIAWVAARAEALPFANASFELALFFTALEFVAEVPAALREALRVVRPGGALVAAILDARSPWAAAYRHAAAQGIAPWNAARFVIPADLEEAVGRAATARAAALFLAPGAEPPFAEADAAGRRAGNEASLAIMRWQVGG